MKICVTGHRGAIGQVLLGWLERIGHSVQGLDSQDGMDVRHSQTVHNRVFGCQAVVHLAARTGDCADTMEVNLLGTWNVLQAAAAAGVGRVVLISSAQVLGVFGGQGAPKYLPLDDFHPLRGTSPYALSKILMEEMASHWCAQSGIPTICLRPPGVFLHEHYAYFEARRAAEPDSEWSPYWEYGAFLDVRDLCGAIECALTSQHQGFSVGLVNALDISSAAETSRELARRLLPGVPWRGGAEYSTHPFLALVRSEMMQQKLGWIPVHNWRNKNGRC